MSLSILQTHHSDIGVAFTFLTEHGLEPMEGTYAEVARLAHVMAQVAAIAPLNSTDRVWVDEVRVGNATVKLGLTPDGAARVRIDRHATAAEQ